MATELRTLNQIADSSPQAAQEFASLEKLLTDANHKEQSKPTHSLGLMMGAEDEDLVRENQAGDRMTFVPRAPRLRQQKEMFALAKQNEGVSQTEEVEKAVEVLSLMASKFLFVRHRMPHATPELRAATVSEIEDYFGMEELNEMVAKYLGMKQSDSDGDSPGK